MRKKHNMDDGYIAERMNPFILGAKVVIYNAKEQGLDVEPNKYAVACDAHETLCGESSVPKARILMKNPHNFCEACASIQENIKQ